ncbi:hypothetical protein LNKW23_03900 [Paralimibaculum aggregatum]|uniref:Uncharacterized protein n=1 Tax=Paralimibaculum aggregatum TaxID=3036245 RepID=A0ABQ6LJ11_9RHOB|nr:hypothetical protein LNKW23_03900 [Limibaculum sp. NKW23]
MRGRLADLADDLRFDPRRRFGAGRGAGAEAPARGAIAGTAEWPHLLGDGDGGSCVVTGTVAAGGAFGRASIRQHGAV